MCLCEPNCVCSLLSSSTSLLPLPPLPACIHFHLHLHLLSLLLRTQFNLPKDEIARKISDKNENVLQYLLELVKLGEISLHTEIPIGQLVIGEEIGEVLQYFNTLSGTVIAATAIPIRISLSIKTLLHNTVFLALS